MARCFLVVVLVLFPLATAWPAEFFQSNELGMAISPIPASQREQHRWVLAIVRRGSGEERTLTDHGEVVKRWSDTYSGGRLVQENAYQKNELVSTTEYRNGYPSRETQYSQGKKTSVREYRYSGNLLQSVSVYDAAGKLEYRDLYAEGSDGRLRRAVREMPDGSRSVAAFNFAGDHLVSQWLGTNGKGVLLRYSDGSVIAKEQWKGSDLTSNEEISMQRSGSESVTRDLATGEVTKKQYDSAGQILSEHVTKKGSPVLSVDYAYSHGLLQSKVTKSPGRREEIRYRYDKEGKLLDVETTVNRTLVKIRHYSGKDSYVEDLYLNGEVVLRVFYKDGKKVNEVPVPATPEAPGGAGGGG